MKKLKICSLVWGDCPHERSENIEKYCKKCKHGFEKKISDKDYNMIYGKDMGEE
jgi:hypothetical protein